MHSELYFDQEFFSAARTGLQSLPPFEQEEIKKFVENAMTDDGYFTSAKNQPDIYVTALGIMLSTLLGIDKNKAKTADYLRSKGHGANLDFLYVVSLARAWRFYPHDSLEIGSHQQIAEKLNYNRCSDHLWNQANGTHYGSIYGTFLAISAYQNLGLTIPDEIKVPTASIKALRSSDGAFGTDRGAATGTTPATSFGILMLDRLEEAYEYEISWLLKQQHTDGGFLAVPQMPFSDIQSTFFASMALAATAPQKLKKMAADIKKFTLSMRLPGGFRGHCKENTSSVEHTILALAILGFVHSVS